VFDQPKDKANLGGFLRYVEGKVIQPQIIRLLALCWISQKIKPIWAVSSAVLKVK
jgi:hypothetical protein